MKDKKGAKVEAGSSKDFKTGDWRTLKPEWDKDKCIHCMKCVIFCPENCIKVKNGKRLETNFDYCKGCGICADVCPVKCIKMKMEEK
ncbi:MAG: 4Fe-4S binding protein [Nanoarchaeota archaeon]|nr:4Fe-4S binding protein [Nanoarchaeota archaeon]